jgi:hypothetical protein
MTGSSKKARALKIAVTLGVLVMVMLATVGAWEVYNGTMRLIGRAHADGTLDLLKCYSAKALPLVPQQSTGKVVLLDQFKPDGEHVFVGQVQLLCVPAKALPR